MNLKKYLQKILEKTLQHLNLLHIFLVKNKCYILTHKWVFFLLNDDNVSYSKTSLDVMYSMVNSDETPRNLDFFFSCFQLTQGFPLLHTIVIYAVVSHRVTFSFFSYKKKRATITFFSWNSTNEKAGKNMVGCQISCIRGIVFWFDCTKEAEH